MLAEPSISAAAAPGSLSRFVLPPPGEAIDPLMLVPA
jgi:hypothetical protein